MSNKMWATADEWVNYAPCGGDIEFVMPPVPDDEGGPFLADGGARVRSICAGCPVRPECIARNTAPVTDLGLRARRTANSMWVAGEWIPDMYTASSRRAVAEVTARLLARLPAEYQDRPSGV